MLVVAVLFLHIVPHEEPEYVCGVCEMGQGGRGL